jgi:hypothetical protein
MRTRHARPLAAAALLTALAACADDARTPLAPAAADTPSLARSGGDATAAQGGTQGGTQRGRKIPDQYVVVLREGASVEETTRRNTIAAQRTFSRALNGFSAKLTRGQVQQLEKDADVLYIAQDEEVQLAQALAEPSVIQASATWGLDRTDQVSRALSGTYGYTATGSGVRVYIVDTGIRTTHAEFDGVADQPGARRLRLRQQRRALGGLQRARHARGRHGRRHGLRHRQGRHARGRARLRLLGRGVVLDDHRGARLGDQRQPAPRRPGGGEHEPRRRRVPGDGRCDEQSRRLQHRAGRRSGERDGR